MSAMDKLIAARRPRQVVQVPSAGLDIWFSPVTTADLKVLQAKKPNTDEEWALMLLVLKAEAEDGTKLFAWSDVALLESQIEAAVIGAIVSQMWTQLEGGDAAVQKAKAAIRADPPSGSASASRRNSTSRSKR